MPPHQGGETCEGPRTGSAARAALAHAVPTAVRLFASPHLGLPLVTTRVPTYCRVGEGEELVVAPPPPPFIAPVSESLCGCRIGAATLSSSCARPRARPIVSIASHPMYMHAAVASIWEVAMLSAPLSDSWEGQNRPVATGDAILGSKFFPTYSQTPSISTF